MRTRAPAHRLNTSTAMDLGTTIFPTLCMTCDQNALERDLSTSLLKTLVAGRGQQSESMEVVCYLDMEQARKFYEPF